MKFEAQFCCVGDDPAVEGGPVAGVGGRFDLGVVPLKPLDGPLAEGDGGLGGIFDPADDL